MINLNFDTVNRETSRSTLTDYDWPCNLSNVIQTFLLTQKAFTLFNSYLRYSQRLSKCCFRKTLFESFHLFPRNKCVCFLTNIYWNLDVFNNESSIANLTHFDSVLALLVFSFAFCLSVCFKDKLHFRLTFCHGWVIQWIN